jgi:uncharacterized alpha-E superfamily protein
VMSHRSRYAVATNRETVVDMLALDGLNPRSVMNQLSFVKDQVAELPGAVVTGQMSELAREVLSAHTGLAVMTAETLDTAALLEVRRRAAVLSTLVTKTYFR